MVETVAVTFFRDRAAARKTEQQITLDGLVDLIRNTTGSTKEGLPWLKLARFGEIKSEKGSLRHDANVTAITGVEGDYDGEKVSFEEAFEIAQKAGVLAILYTSPSHRTERPRFRLLAPTSRELPAAERSRLVARLNGLYGGIFAVESFTLSQSYYYGSVESSPDHRVEVIDGHPIDELDELDETALGKPNGAAGNGALPGMAKHPLDEHALAEAIITAESYHTPAVRLAGKWAQQGIPLLEAQERLYELFDKVFPPDRDARWHGRRAEVPRIMTDIYGKEVRQRDAREQSAALSAPAPRSAAPIPGDDRRDLKIIRFEEMRPRLSGRPLVKGVVEAEQTSLWFGESGCGKTFLCLDLALHIAAGLPWLGRKVRQGAVIYVAAEAGRSIENRVVAFKQAHGLDGASLDFAAVVTPIDLCHPNAGDVDRLIGCIRAAGFTASPVLVIIDTLSRALAGGNENGPDDMGAFVRSIDRLRDELTCHVAVVHHCGKEQSKGARGHSLLRCSVDTEIEIARDRATGVSTSTITKQRDGLLGEKFSFRLERIELGNDSDGDPVTSCVVQGISEPSELSKSKRNWAAAQKRARDLLTDAIARHGEIPPANDHIPANMACVLESLWRECCYAGQISTSDKQDSKRQAFNRAAEALLAAGDIGKWGDWVWVVA